MSNFDAPTKPSDLPPASINRVNFNHHPHENQVNRSSHLKQFFSARRPSISIPRTNKSFSIPKPKPSQMRSLTHKNQTIFDATAIEVNSIPTLKWSQFLCPHTRNKLISIHTLNPNIFRPSPKNQVNFDRNYDDGDWWWWCSQIRSISLNSGPWSQNRPNHFWWEKNK